MKKIILVLFLLTFKLSLAQSGWEQVHFANPVQNFWAFDIEIYNNIGILSSRNSKLMLSTDGGLNWFTSGDSIKRTMKISKINNTIWLGSRDSVPFRSTNGGLNFHAKGNGIINLDSASGFNNIGGSETKIFTGSSDGNNHSKRAYYSTNNGNNWQVIDTIGADSFNSCYADGSFIMFATYNYIFRSYNNGVTWEKFRDSTNMFFGTGNEQDIVKVGDKIYTGFWNLNGRSLPYSTTNSGTNWIWEKNGVPTVNIAVKNLQAYGDYIFFFNGWVGSEMYYKKYYDTVWKKVNIEGNFNNTFIAGDYIYVFHDSNLQHVYRKRIDEVIGIQLMSTTIPNKFYLSQNYPNPFNPATVISFQLPVAGFVKLKVFDLLGREIANLVNENLTAGSYKYDFNASALPSGIYFYKLETENFSETKKMVLVK